MGSTPITTRWQGHDLLVLRRGEVVDRIAASSIRRVILVCAGGDTPSELEFALIDTGSEHLLLPAESGIAGPVYFERQDFWTERACVWWVTGRHAPLPRRLCPGVWLLRRQKPAFLRLPAEDLEALIDSWPLQGPQTWEQRRWARIGARRPLAALVPSSAPEKQNPA